jgi:ubiquitin carboxyl-terminal hydrolase 4/11/15
MQFTGNDFELDAERSDPLSINKDPSWSFKRVPEAHDLEQMTAHPPGSFSNGIRDEDDLFDDNDSTVAVGDGDLDDLDARLLDLKDSPPAGRTQGFKSGPGSEADASFEDIPPLMEDNSDGDLPVVELRVGDDDQMVSD